MMSDMGKRVLCVDLDPQANLTSAFLQEDALEKIWSSNPTQVNTVYQGVRPLLDVGDIQIPHIQRVAANLGLLAGDLGLSRFEDELSQVWAAALNDRNLARPFRILTAFWRMAQQAAIDFEADMIVFDVGPNLGAINRAGLLASNAVVVPLSADLFSLQGLRNLGPTLREWRQGWRKRVDNWPEAEFSLPQGEMKPIGYVAMRHGVRLDRPVKAYTRWLEKIPFEYQHSVLDDTNGTPFTAIANDQNCIAMLKNYQSLIPMGQDAHKPIFHLRPADGAIGAHANAAQLAYLDFKALTESILMRMGMA
jgi:chromosome partitioning protein